MKTEEIRSELTRKRLRVTPQRVAILEAVISLHNHPTAENVSEFLKEHHPNIATGTVYKILEVLVAKGLLKKVKTDRDVMRYDAILDNHHHLYSSESERIEDYFDDGLNTLLTDYFKSHKIQGFEISDIRLQLIGRFRNGKKQHEK
ncbi:MAG: transcriptional repressor [Alphaproteobacteria bacterium]|nr:transcriptional repressor [Alphaproteobacteria bacterium]